MCNYNIVYYSLNKLSFIKMKYKLNFNHYISCSVFYVIYKLDFNNNSKYSKS